MWVRQQGAHAHRAARGRDRHASCHHVIPPGLRYSHCSAPTACWTKTSLRARGGVEGLGVVRSVALNSTVELMRDLGRPRGDLWEVALWEDVLAVQGREAIYTYQVFNEAIVVPEAIDAVRALVGTVENGGASIALTDDALGMRREFLVPPVEATPAAQR